VKVIGYTRVSTEEQGRSGLGLAAQRHAIEQHAEARGWEIEWMTDEGVSAKSLNRPALQAALTLLRTGKAEAIVAAKLDRLSRSVVDFGHLLELSRRQKWGLVVLDFDLDTTTAAGRMLAGVMMQFAQFERELIGERTSAALQAAKARGVRLGRPPTIAPATASRIVALRQTGLSTAKIAAQLNADGVATVGGKPWQASTVARVLSRAEEVAS
jgi:DNA invertase Pin-like site-specific DNA recombinase